MKRTGKLIRITLEIILLLGAVISVVSDSGDWNDYLILGGLILLVPGHIVKCIQSVKDT